MKTYRKCLKCGSYVKKETRKMLRREYPFQCLTCDEDMFRFETINIRRKKR